jgi:hypothetical protein
MAIRKNTTEPSEPVNSDQADAQEAARQAQGAPEAAAGPTAGELEERTVEAEARAEAAERDRDAMREEFTELKRQMAALMAAQRRARVQEPQSGDSAQEAGAQEGDPVFDENAPHGTVVGDTEVAFVQDGHQFGRDRRYIATEKQRGVPRAFNPRLVGQVKPRPGTRLADGLEGLRDQ